MSGYSCKYLNEQITFYPDNISTCCSGFASPRLYEIEDGKRIDFDELVKTKYAVVEDFKNGQINNSILKEYLKLSCEECPHLCEYDEKAEYKQFKRVLINHFTGCNCACTYCVRDTYLTQEEKQSKPKYELLPIIEEMYRKNLISKEQLEVEFQGGDIGCLKEFGKLVNLFAKKSKSTFRFFTNNIVYYKEIQNLLRENRAEIVVSLDCGTRETYKKIKRVDKFENVVNNLRKYNENATGGNVIVKYIFLRNINDNETEITKFIELMKSIGVKTVSIELDYNECMELVPGRNIGYNFPENYGHLIEYFHNTAQNCGINCGMGGYSKLMAEKYCNYSKK